MGVAIAMSDKEGILRMQPSRRWAVCRTGRDPVEITSGELFRVGVDGGLQVRRMEYAHDGRGYYAVDGPEPRSGMRTAIGSEDFLIVSLYGRYAPEADVQLKYAMCHFKTLMVNAVRRVKPRKADIPINATCHRLANPSLRFFPKLQRVFHYEPTPICMDSD